MPHQSPYNATPEQAAHLRKAQMALLFEGAKRSFVINLATVCMFVLTLYAALPQGTLLAWLVAMFGVLAFRAAFYLLFRNPSIRRRCSERLWANVYLFAIFLSGTGWGATIFFLQPDLPPTVQLLLLLFPLAMSTGAVSTFAAWMPAFLAFLIPCLVPVIATLLLGHSSDYWATALAASVYFAALLVLGSNYQAHISEALSLKHGNAKLVEDLFQQNELLRSAKDQAETAAGVKNDFLARISHELRTPMNGVLGSTQVLQSTELSDQQTNLCANIHGSAESLLLIIDEVLEFAELDSDSTYLKNERFDSRGMIQQLIADNNEKAISKGLDVMHSCDEDIPQFLNGDASGIKKVLRNLLDNAIKFTASGSIDIRLRLLEDETSRCKIGFSVRDSGPGIEPVDQKNIFESFSQADNTSTRGYGGVGLGLTLAQRWVSLMGGDISLESEIGKGSTFSFVIWLDKPDASTSSQTLSSVVSLQGAKILVVEDSEINQAVVEALLENMGCTVTIAENGLEAVNAIKAQTFNLVLMDCQMPVMDGYEATKEIRRLEVQSDIIILALTANAMPGDREKCLQSGMDDYLTKPFDAKELERTISQYLIEANSPAVTDQPIRSTDTMTSDENGSVLDAAVLENLRLLDKGKGLICRVIDAFNKSMPALMSDLEAGVAERDVEKIRMPAHTMKSSAANLGALVFSKQCAVIEAKAREGDLDGIEEDFAHLQALLVPVQNELSVEKEQAEARKAA